MKQWKRIALSAGLALCLALAGCAKPDPPQATLTKEPIAATPPPTQDASVSTEDVPGQDAPASTEDVPSQDVPASTEDVPGQDIPVSTEDVPAQDPQAPQVSPAAGQTATLYIGTQDAGFGEYPLSYEGSLTPELLIQGIADLTGWDLTLAQAVTTGKGGMSVCLSGESSLFTGPPDPQNEDFHMYDAEQLAQTILDSIQKTLQKGFTGEGGNPDLLDIYYYMEGEQPLELPALGLSWPLDEPYRWKRPDSE